MSGPYTRVVGKNCRVKTKIKERETRSTREREERTREGGCEGEENRDRFNYADNNHNNGFAYHRALSPPGPSIPPHCSRQPPAFALAFALALARSRAYHEGPKPGEQRASSMPYKHVATTAVEIHRRDGRRDEERDETIDSARRPYILLS